MEKQRSLLAFEDILLRPLVYPAAVLLRHVRKKGVHKLSRCRNTLMNVGVFPISDHYYEPQFDNRDLKSNLAQDRKLPGIQWNIEGQLALISRFNYAQELSEIPRHKNPNALEFYLNNGSFESGDAEYWYQLIRTFKPRRIFEVGSGNSTLMAAQAIHKNHSEDSSYNCQHICIEPYEAVWLEKTGVQVVRRKVEDMDIAFFSQLQANDILFIDSTHVIKPHGDVLFEYLELLPTLNKGVIVHVHDIFSPKNYLPEWIHDRVRFWNEQYLLEAFLSHNNSWEILGALNFLKHSHFGKLKAIAPTLQETSEPGSFYIRKLS